MPTAAASEWERVPILRHIQLPTGQVDPRVAPFRSMPLIAPDHIESGTGRLLALQTAEQQGAISGKYLVEAGDVLYSKIRPHLRKAMLATRPGLCSADMYPLRCGPDLHPRYLLAVLLGEDFTRFATAVSMRSGFPKINREELAEYRLPLPSLAEQRRIAENLDAADEAIAGTEAVIAKLALIRQGLLDDMVGKVLPPHPTVEQVASQEPGATTIGPFGSNLLASDYRPEGAPVVFVRDIKPTGFVWKSEVYVSADKARELAAHSVAPGDVVATKMGLPPCLACLYPEWMPPGVITADVIRVRPDPAKAVAGWWARVLNHEVVRRQVRLITGGVTRPKVTLRDFRLLKLPIPSLEQQSRAVALLDAADARVLAEEAHLVKLKLQRIGLIQDLLSGQVRVAA